MDEILLFIERFSSHSGAVDLFTNGCCYWFAHILASRFMNGKIKYDVIEGHFVTEIDKQLYDITGCVTGRYINLVDWNSYNDDLHKRRIVRDCVNFTEGDDFNVTESNI